MFSCSKIEQKQLNTWVSFQSAEQPLLGQFSVSGNSPTATSDYHSDVQSGEVKGHTVFVNEKHVTLAALKDRMPNRKPHDNHPYN